MAQYTGATPKTTGVWYDDVWDRSFYAPSSGCPAPPGAEVVYDETKGTMTPTESRGNNQSRSNND
jgi:hypothetical protein